MRPSSKFKKQATRAERLARERAEREIIKKVMAERRAKLESQES